MRSGVAAQAALFVAALAAAGCARAPRATPVSQASPVPPVTPRPAASGAVFEPAPPARLIVDSRPLGFSPDGRARWLVHVAFRAADGRPTALLRGGELAFSPSRGSAQWQTRARFDGPAAIVSTDADGPLAVAIRADVGVALAAVRVRTDTRTWREPRISARPLGPREVRIGWFPRATVPVTVRRDSAAGGAGALTVVAPPVSSFDDPAVRPGARYLYTVTIPGRSRARLAVRMPAAPPHASVAALAGKALWLSFSPVADDPDSFERLDPAAIVGQASAAGVRALELRTTYGEFRELDGADRPTIDDLIDRAAARGIAVFAWTVPRAATFEDLTAEIAAASHRTRRGNGFAGLAVDLERGDYFLGDGAPGYAALRRYLAALRAALGAGYPLVATVEDAYLEHLTERDYPYAEIAAEADALQPMAYWRMLSRRAVTPPAVRAALRGSFAALSRAAGRAIPIDLGGQTIAEGPRGAPPPGEVAAAVDEARRLGALGIAFYDWGGTSRAQFAALAGSRWSLAATRPVRSPIPRTSPGPTPRPDPCCSTGIPLSGPRR